MQYCMSLKQIVEQNMKYALAKIQSGILRYGTTLCVAVQVDQVHKRTSDSPVCVNLIGSHSNYLCTSFNPTIRRTLISESQPISLWYYADLRTQSVPGRNSQGSGAVLIERLRDNPIGETIWALLASSRDNQKVERETRSKNKKHAFGRRRINDGLSSPQKSTNCDLLLISFIPQYTTRVNYQLCGAYMLKTLVL